MRRTLGLLISIAVVLCSWGSAAAAASLRVYFFDVGQADAVLIQGPTGQCVLYDAGDSPSKILARLAAINVSHLDLVIASHNHADHIGGLPDVIRRFRPRYYIDNGIPATTLAYRRVLEAVEEAGTQLLEPASRQIRLGGDASLSVLPPPGIPGWEQNDNAVGVILAYGQFRLSLAGDAERREWNWWIEQHPNLLGRVHVHKASHHGSSNGDTITALSILRPEVVIVSVGHNNGYGHPRAETLRLYADGGSTTFRTDLNGTILVEADITGQYTVRVERGEGAKPPPKRPSSQDR